MGTNINMNIPFVKDLSEVTGDFWKAKVFANGEEHLLDEQNQNMMKFAEAIKFEKRRYKFGLGKKGFDGSLYVYREGDQYAMGMIDYADFRDTGSAEKKFCLFTPNIDNGKYSHGKRTHMAESVNIPRAMSNVRRYLRPLTVNQTCGMSYRDVNRSISDSVERLVVAAREVRNKVINSDTLDVTSSYANLTTMPKTDPLTNELKHLVESGYQFIDKELGDRMAEFFKHRNIVTKAKENARESKWTFVETQKNTFGETLFRVATDLEVNKWTMDHIPPENTFTYTQEDLPEELRGKLAVVQMLEDEQFVEDIGYRVNSGAFYVL